MRSDVPQVEAPGSGAEPGPLRKGPSVDGVRALPKLSQSTVEFAHIDQNGHMNFTHYFELLSSASVEYHRKLGFPEDYPQRKGMGLFVVGHDIRYRRELRLGAHLTVFGTLLEASRAGIHEMLFLVDEDNVHIAATLEALTLNVDTSTRAVSPFDPVDLRRLQERSELGALQPDIADWGLGRLRLR